jgi:DNA-binding CsgD family transcriptional regulator
MVETLYQGMMRCYAQLGQYTAALAAYQKGREAISGIPGARLSSQTESLKNKITKSASPDKGKSLLTPKQVEILKWIAQGKSSWDISMILGISERTVKFHVGNILQKLNAVTRTQAVAIALEQGLVEIE